MVPNLCGDDHSVKSVRLQNGNGVNSQLADNQANVLPVLSATEPCSQPGKFKDSTQQIGGYEEQVLQADVRPRRMDYSGDIVYVNPTGIQPLVQQKNYPPATSHDVENDNLEPSVQPARRKDSVSKKDSCRHQEQVPVEEDNTQRNEVRREGSVHMNVDDHSRAVTDEARVIASVKDNEPIVILQTDAVKKVWHNADIAVENAAAIPVHDGIYKGRISDAGRRESLHDTQYSFASSISHGEVIADVHVTSEWSDTDTVAEDAVSMAVYDSICEGRTSESQRRESTDKSLYPMQSSFATSVSNGEIIAGTHGTMDLLDTEDQSLPVRAANSAPSKTSDQPALNPGTRQLFSILSNLHSFKSIFIC